jgi:hypothetical protein
MTDREQARRRSRPVGSSKRPEAARFTVCRTLGAKKAIKALERLRKRGTWGKYLES